MCVCVAKKVCALRLGGSDAAHNELLSKALDRIRELEMKLASPSEPSPLQRSGNLTPASLAEGGPMPAPVTEVWFHSNLSSYQF